MSRIKKLKQKIKDFFITNSFFRKLKIITNGIVKTIIIRIILFVIAIFLIILIALQIYKPNLINQAKLRATKYFYQTLKLDKARFSKINIIGNQRLTKEEIIATIKDFEINNSYLINENKQNIDSFFMIQNLINEMKIKMPWLDKVVIKRTMPDIINIEITEYQPFAIWINNDKKYIIDKDGNTIPFLPEYEESTEFKNMIILSGKGANKNAKSLFNILAINSSISQEIYSANWVGDRRWDIRFYDGLIVKLPEINIEKAWQDLIKFYQISKVNKSIKSIDLRVSGKIYIKHNNNNDRLEQVKSIDS